MRHASEHLLDKGPQRANYYIMVYSIYNNSYKYNVTLN